MLNLARTLHTVIRVWVFYPVWIFKMKLFRPDCLGKADFIICSPAWLENPSVFAIEFAKWNHFEGLFFWPALLFLLPFPVCFQGSLLVWADHAILSSSLGWWNDAAPGDELCPHLRPHSWIPQQLLHQTLRGQSAGLGGHGPELRS